ncbi:nucleotidyltransferase substrate binding protein [Virgibacillus sp. NKC19-16]|uniref:nucleotidyltransferase substrate binding protein n=1 Tax=Virgibacillus salidurans TaxID=2831673 RepID=UPI001F3B7706|nr:nucleotidyltransferase substrate binding protein [Virgibacillus sp. NKC19-16]UJL45235.1 nucleotidyltransferase substrate binding protein [Virgibacillus sp. NKC19-16]
MERLNDRLQNVERNLNTLQEILDINIPSTIERNAGFQRFKNSFESCWKAAKHYLYDIEGLDIGSPKGVIRSFREIGLLSENETVLGLRMVNDRNMTVHMYNEELAVEIFGNLPQYYQFLRDWGERMNEKL